MSAELERQVKLLTDRVEALEKEKRGYEALKEKCRNYFRYNLADTAIRNHING